MLAAYAERRAARGAGPPALDAAEETARGRRHVTVRVPAPDAELNQAQMAHATGLLELPAQAHALSALTTVLGGAHARTDLTAQLNTALALLSELGPRTGLEGLLCAQMVATHEAALVMLGRAMPADQPTERVDRQVTRAVRLQRLFLEQAAALAKLRGQGTHQTVHVTHEHRHAHLHAPVHVPVQDPAPGSGTNTPWPPGGPNAADLAPAAHAVPPRSKVAGGAGGQA